MVSAVGSYAASRGRSRGGGGAGRLRGVAARRRLLSDCAPRPLCGQVDAEVVNSTGPWLGPAFAVSGPALPPLLVGLPTVAGAQAAGNPAPGRGARAASGRRQ